MSLNLPRHILQSIRRNRYKAVLSGDDQLWRGADLSNAWASWEEALTHAGVKEGEEVELKGARSPEYAICLLASLGLGVRPKLAATDGPFRASYQGSPIARPAPAEGGAMRLPKMPQGQSLRIETPEGALNAEALSRLFGQLDERIAPKASDVLLLSMASPPFRFAVDLLWAFSRGIAVVCEPADYQNLDRHLPDEQCFSMDFGLFYFGSYSQGDNGVAAYRLLLDSTARADELGFSSVWTPERHFHEFGGLFPNPSVLGAALAVNTQKLQIRSGSLVSPLHDELRIAEEWAVVDNLSQGRTAISFASGWQADDFVFQQDRYARRHEVMFDQIETVQELWRGGAIRRKNGMGKEIEISVYPRPVQEELPTWVTVSGKTETFVDAGKIGANILTHMLWQDPSELIGKIQAYRESLRESGFDPASRSVSVMIHTFLGEDMEEVRQKVRQPLKDYIRSSVFLIETMTLNNQTPESREALGRFKAMDGRVEDELMEELLDIAFERFFQFAGLLGTVEHCKAMVAKLQSYGVDDFACLVDFGLSREEIMASLEHLNELRQHYDVQEHKRLPVSLVQAGESTPHNWMKLEGNQRMAAVARPLDFRYGPSGVEDNGQVAEAALNAEISEDF